MASLTGSGLSIQSSIPAYTSSRSNISLQYFQVCSLSGAGGDGIQTYSLSGMCMFILPFNYWLSTGAGYDTVFGSTIKVRSGNSSETATIGALRIY